MLTPPELFGIAFFLCATLALVAGVAAGLACTVYVVWHILKGTWIN